MQGKVKVWFIDREFGFIRGADGADYFTHLTKVARDDQAVIATGAPVEFRATEGAKGRVAIDVKVIREPKKQDSETDNQTPREHE